MKKLDDTTFGKTPAALKLVEIINEKNFKPQLIGKHLTKFSQTLHELEKIDYNIGLGLSELSFNKIYEHLNVLPIPLNTFSINVLVTNYRIWKVKQKNKIIANKIN